MNSFVVRLDVFHGPLDLLLYLVRKEEVEILDVELMRITQAYLAFIDVLAEIDLDEVGEFLVVASILMEIKSRLLLPRVNESETEDEETDERTQLVAHLLEYKRFKEAGALLWRRAEQQKQKLARIAAALAVEPTDPARQPIRGLELWDLVSAFGRLIKENVVPVAEGIVRDPTPVSVYMERLLKVVLDTGGIPFRDLLGRNNSKVQLIGKFLALLELVKTQKVWIDWIEGTDDVIVLPPRLAAVAAPETPAEAELVVPPPTATAFDEVDDEPVMDVPMLPETGAWSFLASAEPAAPSESAWDDFEPIVQALEGATGPIQSSPDVPPDAAMSSPDAPPPTISLLESNSTEDSTLGGAAGNFDEPAARRLP